AVGSAHVTEIFQAIDEPRRRRGGVAHPLCDFGHGQMILLRQKSKEAILRERNVAPGKLLREIEDEAALQARENISEPLGVGTGAGVLAGLRHKVKAVDIIDSETSVNRCSCLLFPSPIPSPASYGSHSASRCLFPALTDRR